MKNLIHRLNFNFPALVLMAVFCLFGDVVSAQAPQGLPQPDNNEPIDLSSPFSIIFFIVIPVLAILLYLYLKNRKNRK